MNKDELIKALETEYTYNDAIKIAELIIAKQNENTNGNQIETLVRQLPSLEMLDGEYVKRDAVLKILAGQSV
jgi:hypothetical protein